MEYFLEIADDYFFDRAYAYVLPAVKFLPSTLKHLNDSIPASTPSTLLQYIPHPPLPAVVDATISAWPRDYMLRQFTSFYIMVL